jgi:hypothetical protein
MLSVIRLSVTRLGVTRLGVTRLGVNMLNVTYKPFMVSVIMLNVVAPKSGCRGSTVAKQPFHNQKFEGSNRAPIGTRERKK